ncbi:MAG: CDP-diacylglycerol--glycerol-3-phosphate 3-phosphatidyltransferase [Desulfuromonadaceae bacterium]|nr:CDP-diacylglycerol--glycerol-3-phosphate 3-phosphatidyltransferase [Desulfuromonadaceae bacterium]
MSHNGPFNLPNMLTLARIACIPILVLTLLKDTPGMSLLAALIFSLASITDWLDGYLARRLNLVTVMGKFLDPLADKLIVMAALIMMIPLGRVPAWAVFLLIAREVIVTGLRSVASSEGVVIAASDLGKYKTIFQMVAIIGLLIHYDYCWFFGLDISLLCADFHNVGTFFFYIALFLTLWSGLDYLVKFFRVLEG